MAARMLLEWSFVSLFLAQMQSRAPPKTTDQAEAAQDVHDKLAERAAYVADQNMQAARARQASRMLPNLHTSRCSRTQMQGRAPKMATNGGTPAEEGDEDLAARAAGVADQHAQRGLAQLPARRALRHLNIHHARAPQAHVPVGTHGPFSDP